jgi:hypothetical protein
MPRPPWEVADVFRLYGPAYRDRHGPAMSAQQLRVMRAIETCRTAVLGGHVEVCDQCGERRVSYNSCRDRHCPKCQSLAKARWLEERLAELLPVEYFHVVFTLPNALAPIALQNRRRVYDLLFGATAEALTTIAADPRHLGAEIGFLAVLHTWGQRMDAHPHLHCIVPGGGFDPTGERWISCRPGFLLPVRVLSRLFRGVFLDRFRRLFRRGELALHGDLEALSDAGAFEAFLAELRQSEWVVYAKPPFGGPEKVLDYLGRYTHRVAISNHRIVSVDGGKVAFRWRDYRHGSRQRTLTLDADEFIRRFLLHVLPTGFHRIRQFGFLANRHRAEKLGRARALLDAPAPPPRPEAEPTNWKDLHQKLTGEDLHLCPACGKGRLLHLGTLPPDSAALVTPPASEGIDSS